MVTASFLQVLESRGRLPTSVWALALSMVATGAVAQNLYPHPDFNDGDGTTGWTLLVGVMVHDTLDASDCPLSGSLNGSSVKVVPLVHQLLANGPCVPFAEPAEIAVSFRYRGFVSSFFDDNEVFARAYPNGACDGQPSDSVGLFFQDVVWTTYSGTLSVPAGGSMAWRVASVGDFGGTLWLDEIRATMQPHVFLDDFEGGGTCRWSATVP